MTQHGSKLYDFRLVDSYDEIDPHKEAFELRRIIWDEIGEDYSNLDMEAEFGNPIFYSPQEIASKPVPLRYVRRLLGRSDLEFLPLPVLRSLLESAGFLDKPIAPFDAQQMLRFCNPARPGFMAEALREAPGEARQQQSVENVAPACAGSTDEARHSSAHLKGTEQPDVGRMPAKPKDAASHEPIRHVSESEMTKWYREWSARPENQPDDEEGTIAAARAHFAGKRFPRDLIRKIRGPQKRGPKRFRG